MFKKEFNEGLFESLISIFKPPQPVHSSRAAKVCRVHAIPPYSESNFLTSDSFQKSFDQKKNSSLRFLKILKGIVVLS